MMQRAVLKYLVVLYLLLSYLISWGAKFFMSAQITGHMDHGIPLGILQLMAQFGPSIAGVIMIFVTGGITGISALFQNLARVQLRFKWYAFALVFELILFLVIVLFADQSGSAPVLPGAKVWLVNLRDFIINTVVLSLLTGLGEEIGWRGFLLPRLQSRLHILFSALVLALFISFWHLRIPDIGLLLNGDLNGFFKSYLPDMGLRILISVPVTLVTVYLFNKTRGSLVLMILFHGASNASYEWVKGMTGMADPSFTLPWFALLLWITSLYFIPALFRQGKKKEVVAEL